MRPFWPWLPIGVARGLVVVVMRYRRRSRPKVKRLRAPSAQNALSCITTVREPFFMKPFAATAPLPMSTVPRRPSAPAIQITGPAVASPARCGKRQVAVPSAKKQLRTNASGAFIGRPRDLWRPSL